MKVVEFLRKSLAAILAGIALTTPMFVLIGAAYAAEDNKPITIAITAQGLIEKGRTYYYK